MVENMAEKKKSLIHKTDSAVKTTEAWTAFATSIWEARGFFTPVGTLGGIMIAAVVRIFGLGWEYAVLAGIPLFILAALVWLALSWIWYLRPNATEVRTAGVPRKPSQFVGETSLTTSMQNSLSENKEKLDKLHDNFWELSALIHEIKMDAKAVESQQDIALELLWEQKVQAMESWPQAVRFFAAVAQTGPLSHPYSLLTKVVCDIDISAASRFYRGYEKNEWPDADVLIDRVTALLPKSVLEKLQKPQTGVVAPFMQVFDEDMEKEVIAGSYYNKCDWFFTQVVPSATYYFAENIGVPRGAGDKYSWMNDMKMKLGNGRKTPNS